MMQIVTKHTPAPWQHQLEALAFAMPKDAALLAIPMGGGKSRVVVDLIQSRNHKRTLIVCPAAVVDVWPTEFDKYAVKFLHVDVVTNKNHLQFPAPDYIGGQYIAVISYDRFWREPYKTWIKKANFDLVVLDESHKIKSPASKAAKFAHQLTKIVPWRLALTGTPLHDRPVDAYSQFKYLDPAVFGTRIRDFRTKYIEFDEFGPYVPYVGHVRIKGYKNQDEFKEKFYSLAFAPEHVELDLPPLTFTDRYTELPKNVKRLYKEFHKDFIIELDGQYVVADNVLTRLTKLQQIANGRVIDDDGDLADLHYAKLNLLEGWLEDLPETAAAVVFYQYQGDADYIRNAVDRARRVYYEQSGQYNHWLHFQHGNYNNAVIAVQIKAGSAGISLTRASHAAFYSAGFSRGDYEQAIKRLHRPGQHNHVSITRLIVKGTVDQDVYDVLQGKGDVIDELLKQHESRAA